MASVCRRLVGALAFSLAGSALAGCDRDDRPDYRIAAFEAEIDQCGVAEVVRDYVRSGARNDAPRKAAEFFAQDRDALLRVGYKQTDRHFLRMLVRDEWFAFRPGCRSRIRVVRAIAAPQTGAGLSAGDFEFDLRAVGEEHLCREHRVRRRLGAAARANTVWDMGVVQTCVDVRSGRTTLGVWRSASGVRRPGEARGRG